MSAAEARASISERAAETYRALIDLAEKRCRYGENSDEVGLILEALIAVRCIELDVDELTAGP